MISRNLQTKIGDPSRPYVTTVLAMSADGKISDVHRTAAKFPSVVDKQHLEQCVAASDATLFGAATLRAYGTTALVKDADLLDRRQSPQPIHIVCSASGELDPAMAFFCQPVPRWLLTTVTGARHWQDNQHFDRVWVAPISAAQSGETTADMEGDSFDWSAILAELKTQNINQLLVMGGGRLVAALMAHDLVDELWLTICPVILGGQQAPTPCDGAGFSLNEAPRFTLVSHRSVGDELFLNYQRRREV
ncbi:MAG: RibD family protein [Cyanobacteria bacterium J06642_11]